MSAFVGSWKLTESVDFDEVLKKMGVSFATRKIASTLKPVMTFSIDGDKMRMITKSTFKTTDIEFNFGIEFDETTADGRVVKSTIVKDSEDKLTHYQKHEKGDTVIIREIKGDVLETTVKFGDLVAVRKYVKQ